MVPVPHHSVLGCIFTDQGPTGDLVGSVRILIRIYGIRLRITPPQCAKVPHARCFRVDEGMRTAVSCVGISHHLATVASSLARTIAAAQGIQVVYSAALRP